MIEMQADVACCKNIEGSESAVGGVGGVDGVVVRIRQFFTKFVRVRARFRVRVRANKVDLDGASRLHESGTVQLRLGQMRSTDGRVRVRIKPGPIISYHIPPPPSYHIQHYY